MACIDGQVYAQFSAGGFSEGRQPYIARIQWPRGKHPTAQGFTAAAFCPISAVYRALRGHRAWCGRIEAREKMRAMREAVAA